MPLTPPTTPRFGAPRAANVDTFDIERDVTAGFDKLDLAAKFTSSLSTARPTSPVVDQYNYSTDTNVLERWNGSAWVRPEPKPHAASHQDGGTDALTVREAMMATGATGLARACFAAYRNAALSLATGQAVVFDTEEFDVGNYYDPATGRFTPGVAGYYRLNWSLRTNAVVTADTWWASCMRKGGFDQKYGQFLYQRGTGAGPISVGTAIVQANGTTDYFDIRTDHNIGGSVALQASLLTTYFQGELIGRS